MIYKLFLWENGEKYQELTKYLVLPIFIEEHVDETLDTGEIILDNMDISTKEMFPPKTKIRIEIWQEEYLNLIKFYDMVVDHDDVEEYVGLKGKCCHRINLIEASVIAQSMHVDNFSLTYELNDVTLNYKTTRKDNLTIGSLNDEEINNLKPVGNESHSYARDKFTRTTAPLYGDENNEGIIIF